MALAVIRLEIFTFYQPLNKFCLQKISDDISRKVGISDLKYFKLKALRRIFYTYLCFQYIHML